MKFAICIVVAVLAAGYYLGTELSGAVSAVSTVVHTGSQS